jgi:hypothetical protein
VKAGSLCILSRLRKRAFFFVLFALLFALLLALVLLEVLIGVRLALDTISRF